MKKFKVTLAADERQSLHALIATGKATAKYPRAIRSLS
jgi:hypothetical protein